jgi:hypothetical protein
MGTLQLLKQNDMRRNCQVQHFNAKHFKKQQLLLFMSNLLIFHQVVRVKKLSKMTPQKLQKWFIQRTAGPKFQLCRVFHHPWFTLLQWAQTTRNLFLRQFLFLRDRWRK